MTSTSVMTERIGETSVRPKARIAGAFYLLTFLAGGVAAVSGRFVVSGDATATASNILAHERSFWLGFAAYLIVVACYITVTAPLYELFRSVDRNLSLLAAFFSLVGCAIQASICLFLVAPSVLLGGNRSLSIFSAEQLLGASPSFSRIVRSGLQHRLRVFRILLCPDGKPHFQVDLPAANSERAHDDQRFGLADLSVTAARRPSVSLQSGRWPREGSVFLLLLVMGVSVSRWNKQAGAAAFMAN